MISVAKKLRVSMNDIIKIYWDNNGEFILDCVSKDCYKQKADSKTNPKIGDYVLIVPVDKYVNDCSLDKKAVKTLTKKISRGLEKKGFYVSSFEVKGKEFIKVYDSKVWYLFDLYDNYMPVVKISFLTILTCLIYLKLIGGI